MRSPVLTISIAALGELPKGRRPLTRGGAKPGDLLMVTGTLGDAAAGLDLLMKRKGRGSGDAPLKRRLLRPVPRLDVSARIAAVPGVTAMMDSSDGLWRSAWWIAKASKAGVRIETELLPLSPALRAWARRAGEDPADKALSGGEDYELVLTARPAAARRLEARGWARLVGRIEADHGVRVFSNGQPRSVPHGFEHFG